MQTYMVVVHWAIIVHVNKAVGGTIEAQVARNWSKICTIVIGDVNLTGRCITWVDIPGKSDNDFAVFTFPVNHHLKVGIIDRHLQTTMHQQARRHKNLIIKQEYIRLKIGLNMTATADKKSQNVAAICYEFYKGENIWFYQS
jgi:hypothetical protein